MRFARAVVKARAPILILAVLLMIPSAVGMAKTRINYDMLSAPVIKWKKNAEEKM